MNDELIEKICGYVTRNRNNYGITRVMNRFYADNPDAKKYAEAFLLEHEWAETESNALFLISHGFHEQPKCKSCGKELNVYAVKRGSIYCSGGCKSRDAKRKESDQALRKERESIYEVDRSIPISDDLKKFFTVNGSKPSADVQKKIEDFARKDSKGNGLYNLISENADVDSYLTTLVKTYSFMEDKKRAFWFAKNGLYEGVKCRTCGNYLTFRQVKDKHKYCSDKCSANSTEVKEHLKQSFIDHYGHENPMLSNEVKNRLKDSMVEKYGVENASNVEGFKKKREETMMKRHGVNCYFNHSDYAGKRKSSCMEKYGTEYASQCESVKKKARMTNIARYGVENPSKSNEFIEKIKENTRHYRFEFIKSHYGRHVVPMFSEDEYSKVQGINCNWKCLKCGNVFEDHRHGTNNAFRKSSPFPLCPACYPAEAGFSLAEKQLTEYVKSIVDTEIIENTRNVISPLELDIYLPEKKMAIEFDGLYWHGEKCGKGEEYHLYKTEECEKKGIRLIHVFEDEWNCKQDIVKGRLRSILGIGGDRVFARKCQIKEISANESNAFLDLNHLQGADNSKYHYGLYHDGELIAVMTFGKPRFNKAYDYELIRYCSKIGCNVVGGASKLLAHFRRNHKGSIISYADRRYSDGNLYEKLGFVKIDVSKPNYWYVKGYEKMNRYQCQKHKLASFLETFDSGLSECENMFANGYDRVYDCGNIVFAMS